MSEPLLLTKLYVLPPRPQIVLRPRLVERLNEGLALGRKLTLISAPAGFGKTTLVSEWASECGLPVTWLSLDEGDNDTTRFLTYLIAALQMLPSKTGGTNIGAEAMAVLQSPQSPPTEFILTTLLNDIISVSDKFVLVLDDYHLIDSRPVDEALTFLIEHAPPQMHLVITSREDPSLPLARLRVRGQMTELRASDLRFSPAEATEFLNRVMGLDLSGENIATLESRTEGWIAGLLLAALALRGTISMKGNPGAANFIQSFSGSHHFVLDYLLEEVLRHQSKSVQDFLLRTSILNRLCEPLCDAVSQDTEVQGTEVQKTGGQATLEYLERANLFIVPLDNERRWYRYHHLFEDLLRQRLGQSRSPAEIAEYHLRASLWYEKNGDMDEAFQHAFAASDIGRSAALAEAAYQGMDNRFQTAAWLSWVKKLPEEAVRVRPVLSTQMGQAFMDAGEPEGSEIHLQDAERCLRNSSSEIVVTDETQLEALPAMIAMTRAYNAQVQGDLADTVKYAELALKLIPESDIFRRAQATITLEVTHWTSGDLRAARSAFDDWMNSMRKAGNIVFVVASAFALADIQVAQGCLREAAQTNQLAIQLAAEYGPDAQQITAHNYLGLAMLYHEMGEDTAFAEHLQKAEELGKQTTLVDWPYRWHVAQARLKESGGELEAALVLLEEARRRYVKTPIPDTRPIDTLKAEIYLKQGRLDKAQEWARMRGLSADDELNYLNEFEHLVLARVLIAEYQSRQEQSSILQAAGLLERLLKAAEAQQRTGSVLEILIVRALALQAVAHKGRGDLSLALAALEQALVLAQPEGYVRLFLDEGEPAHLLLLDLRSRMEKLSNRQSYPFFEYVERLLSAFGWVKELQLTIDPHQAVLSEPTSMIKPALPIEAKVPPAKTGLVEPLSERELEVLRLSPGAFQCPDQPAACGGVKHREGP